MSMKYALLPAARKARKEEIASIHADISILEIERRRAALKATKDRLWFELSEGDKQYILMQIDHLNELVIRNAAEGRALNNDGITQLMSAYAIA